MTLDSALRDFEVTLREFAPDFADGLGNPASEDDFAQLRAALDPYEIPADVETLYRWHNGAEVTAFAGRIFLSIPQLIQERASRGWPAPDLWLPMFVDVGGGRLLVEATSNGHAEPYVWLTQKEYGPTFEYLNLETFFVTLREAIRGDLVEVVTFDSGHSSMNAIDPGAYQSLTRLRNPRPDSVRASHSMFPDAAWPSVWLRAMGIDPDAIVPTGAPSPAFALLVARAQAEEVNATVTGTIGRGGSSRDAWWFTLSDGTADLYVETTAEIAVFDFPKRGARIEADVVMGPSVVRTEIPNAGESRFPGQPARAFAIRWYPSAAPE